MSLYRHFASQSLSSCVTLVLLTTALFLGLGLPAAVAPAHAYGVNECAASRMGSNLGCNAGDVSITGIAVAPGSPTACVGGTTFTVDLDITVNFATPDRWDIGIFLANDGKNPQTLPVNGGAASCNVGILPTESPFLDLDPNGGTDTCGDGNGAINGGTGSGILRMKDVPVACQAISLSGGNLYIPFVVSWDNQSSPSGATCSSIADPVPNTVSKCNAPKTTVATEVQYGTVNAVVLPAITKTDDKTTVNPGDTSTYRVVVTNTTGVPLSNAVFRDPATANLNVTSVSCGAGGGATCPAPATVTVANMQGGGITIPPMPVNSSVTFTINTTVANPIVPAYSHLITNTAYVTVGPVGNRKSNAASDSDTINGAVYSDLSTSTKTVVDLNGGEANPGDVLRYTITLYETAGLVAANSVSVTDDIPSYTTGFAVVSIPAGATNVSTGSGTGANGTGYLNVTGIDIPAGSSATVVFDVTVAGGTPAGTVIDNVATVANPGGPGGNPSAPLVTVSPSAVQLTDNKQLYLYGTAPYKMSRNPPTGTPPSVTIAKDASATWNGDSPIPLQLNNTISSAYASIFLTGDGSRKAEARLYCSSSATAYASSGVYDLGTLTATPTQYNFNLTNLSGGFGFPATCAAGNYWQLMLINHSTGGTPSITVVPVNGSDHSRLNMASSNIIYVESLDFYNAAYPGGAAVTAAPPGATLYVRSVVSDPFGSFDITSARIDITDPNGTPVVANALMTPVADSGTSTKTFEYAFTIPPGATNGNWSVKVTAHEGSEGSVRDDLASAFAVSAPNFTFLKFSQVERDPVNLTSKPKAIPGADVLYTLQASNSGTGKADDNSIYFIDPIPPNTKLFVADLGQGGPVIFSDPDADSGFTSPPLPFTLAYFSDATCSNSVAPSPDADGFDANVRCLRINMTGSMNGAVPPVTPDFSLIFRVRIQ